MQFLHEHFCRIIALQRMSVHKCYSFPMTPSTLVDKHGIWKKWKRPEHNICISSYCFMCFDSWAAAGFQALAFILCDSFECVRTLTAQGIANVSSFGHACIWFMCMVSAESHDMACKCVSEPQQLSTASAACWFCTWYSMTLMILNHTAKPQQRASIYIYIYVPHHALQHTQLMSCYIW